MLRYHRGKNVTFYQILSEFIVTVTEVADYYAGYKGGGGAIKGLIYSENTIILIAWLKICYNFTSVFINIDYNYYTHFAL